MDYLKFIIVICVSEGMFIVWSIIRSKLEQKYKILLNEAMRKDEKTFNELLDKRIVRMAFRKFNREFIRLRYYIAIDNEEKVSELANLLEGGLKQSKDQKYAVLNTLYLFYITKRHQEKANEYRNKLHDFIDANQLDQNLVEEIDYSYGIYREK